MKQFLIEEFSKEVLRLEAKVKLTPEYLDDVNQMKKCILDVQQKYFDLKLLHRDYYQEGTLVKE